jgi:hypothetical protein
VSRPSEKRPDAPTRIDPYNHDMLFDQVRGELPVATVRSRGRVALAAAVHRWFAGKWGWLRPRMVPVAVAFVGMVAVLASVNALTHLAQKTPERAAAVAKTPDENLAQSAETMRLLTSAPAAQPNVFAMFPGSTVRFIPLCAR